MNIHALADSYKDFPVSYSSRESHNEIAHHRNSWTSHHIQTCHIFISSTVRLSLHHWRGWKSIIYLFCIVIVQCVSVTCIFVFKETFLSSGLLTLERNRITESQNHTITVFSVGLRCARMAGNNPKRGAGC